MGGEDYIFQKKRVMTAKRMIRIKKLELSFSSLSGFVSSVSLSPQPKMSNREPSIESCAFRVFRLASKPCLVV